MLKNGGLSTSLEVLRDCPVLKVMGVLDASTSPGFRQTLDGLFVAGYKILLLDFTGLSFMDSSGVGALIYAHRSSQEQGGKLLWIAGCTGQIRSLLEVTQLDREIQCFDSLPHALDAWKRTPD